MKKAVLILFAALLVSVITLALDDTPENRAKQTDRYLTAVSVRELMNDLADQMAASLPADQRQAFRELMNKYFDITVFEKAMRQAMTRNFTADELQALADFYGSAVGKSAMKKFPKYMAELFPAAQAEVEKAFARAKQDGQPK